MRLSLSPGCVSAVAVLFLCFWSGCNCCPHSSPGPHQVVFPYEWGGEIEAKDLDEPSGAVYDAARESLFVVGDEGDLCQLKPDGEVVRLESIRGGADIEGITQNPATDLLYVAIEGEEKVLEVDPDTFAIRREFELERSFQGEVVFEESGDGVEGITFVPDPDHPEGGTFVVTNQSFTLEPGEERSLLVEVELPLQSGDSAGGTGRILRVFAPGVIDLSALHYSAERNTFFVLSDATNTFYEIDRDWRILKARAFPGASQEGLAIDGNGMMYVAQDSGGLIAIRPTGLGEPL